jgi:hypothetical protein
LKEDAWGLSNQSPRVTNTHVNTSANTDREKTEQVTINSSDAQAKAQIDRTLSSADDMDRWRLYRITLLTSHHRILGS